MANADPSTTRSCAAQTDEHHSGDGRESNPSLSSEGGSHEVANSRSAGLAK